MLKHGDLGGVLGRGGGEGGGEWVKCLMAISTEAWGGDEPRQQ